MRHVGLILVPVALLLSGCSRNKAGNSATTGGVEGQIMLSAAYGTVLPPEVRVSSAEKLQRTLIAKGWKDVELDTSGLAQIALRIPVVAGQSAEKAIRDLQSLQTVPPVRLMPLYGVCYRTPDGVVGPLFAPVEYAGGQRFREMATGRPVSAEEATAGQLGFGPFERTQITGAHILPGSVSTPSRASGRPLTVTFQVRPGHAQDWLAASGSLQALLIDGKVAGVFAPDSARTPGSETLVGTIRVKAGADDMTAVTLEFPATDAGLPRADDIVAGLAKGAVPPPPVSVRVIYAGPRIPGDRTASQGPWRRRRGRWAQIEYKLPPTSNGKPVTPEQCSKTVAALEERARVAGIDYRFQASGTKSITGMVRVFRGFRRTTGTAMYTRLIQRGDWAILRLRPHGKADGVWSPSFDDGWVVWRRSGSAETKKGCRVEDLDQYLRADAGNILIKSVDAVPASAVADTGTGLEGTTASVIVALKPATRDRWIAFRIQNPEAVAGVFLDGVLISRFKVADRPVSGNAIAVLRSRLLPPDGGTAPSGRGISDNDAQALAGLLELPPIPLQFVDTSYKLVEQDAQVPASGFGSPFQPRARRP